MIDEGTLLFAGVMGLGLAAALITGASLLSNAIARRLRFKPLDDPFGDHAHGDIAAIPADLKVFHGASNNGTGA